MIRVHCNVVEFTSIDTGAMGLSSLARSSSRIPLLRLFARSAGQVLTEHAVEGSLYTDLNLCTSYHTTCDTVGRHLEGKAGEERLRFFSQERQAIGSTDQGLGANDRDEGGDLQRDILEYALEMVPIHGWSRRTLEEAAKRLDVSPAAAGSFSRGAAELVDYFNAICDARLKEELSRKTYEDGSGSLHDKLRDGVIMRLNMIVPFIGMSTASDPKHLTLLKEDVPSNDPRGIIYI